MSGFLVLRMSASVPAAKARFGMCLRSRGSDRGTQDGLKNPSNIGPTS
jgi:hypothetical protein